jgi:hypothetical protein
VIAVAQTKRGGPGAPPEERGDCLPACLASLLEIGIEDVPVPHSDDVHWWDAVQAALKPHGYHFVIADCEYWPGGYWIAAVPSLNLTKADGSAVNHVVVMREGELVHDPSLGRRYDVGTPRDALDVIEAYVLVPFEPVSLAAHGDFPREGQHG